MRSIWKGIKLSLTKEEPPVPDNVIFIVLDALRRDGLSWYGNKRKTSPNIDRLAKRGVTFTQAISAAGATPGALGAIVTSKYPYFITDPFPGPQRLSDFGFSRFAEEGENIAAIPRNLKTFAQFLSEAGYTTAGFSANPMTTASFGFTKGFEFYEDFNRENWDAHPDGKVVTDAVIQWLSREKKHRFFLFLHYMDIHGPYEPRSPYDRMFRAKYLRGKTDSEFHRDWYSLKDQKYLAELRPHMRALYDAGIRYLDDQLGALFKTLSSHDLFSNSIIVIVADHGDEFLEHGGVLHQGGKLYDELIHVPFILYLPFKMKRRRIDRLVRSVDVLPTILDILHIELPSDIEGLPLLRLPQDFENGLPRLSAYADGPYKHCIRTEKWKLIQDERENSVELYDIINDPSETHNVFNPDSETAKVLFSELLATKQKILQEGRQTTVTDPAAMSTTVEGEIAKRLRALGYL